MCEKCTEQAVKAKKAPASRTLTREMLLKGYPCTDYRELFLERFPESGVDVTLELALSQIDDWDWFWAGTVLLSRNARAEFIRRDHEADDAYNASIQPFLDLHNAKLKKYYDARNKIRSERRALGLPYLPLGDLDEATGHSIAVTGAAADAARETANKLRKQAQVKAFVELFLMDGEAYEQEHKDDGPLVEEAEEDEDW